ncbi:MAG: FO synthase, partial [Zhongshania aliphaticivorans]
MTATGYLTEVAPEGLSEADALRLAELSDSPALMQAAAQLRDRGFNNGVSYSRK